MRRVFRSGFATLAIIMLIGPLLMVDVFAQNSNIDNFFNFNNKPVNYDSPYVIGRGTKSPDSIDQCLKRKEFFFNEYHNVWVDGLIRCEKNSTGVLSKSTYQGISGTPEDEQACKGLRDGQILVNGTPSENQARYWSEHCSYLGTVGGAGPVTTKPPVTSGTSATGSRTLGTPNSITLGTTGAPTTPSGSTSGTTTPDPNDKFNPVYDGPGVVVPGKELVAKGISKETSLINLIIFYTNVTLPYVSVLSIFAFVTAGLYYILTFANEELNGKAKTIMLYVVIGIVIIFSSYTLVNFLLGLSATAG